MGFRGGVLGVGPRGSKWSVHKHETFLSTPTSNSRRETGISRLLLVLILFFLFLQFPELWLFTKPQEICFSVLKIVLSWQRFKKHDLPELAEALHLPERFCYSQGQKEENQKDLHGKGISKIEEKLISHLNLTWLFILHDSSLTLSATHFFIAWTRLAKENYRFRSMELDNWPSSKLNKTTKTLLTVFSAHIIYLSYRVFAVAILERLSKRRFWPTDGHRKWIRTFRIPPIFSR